MKNVNKYVLFAMSYVLNALGNALTVKGAVGTLMWTSTFENLAAFFSITVGTASSIVAVLSYIVSKIIGKDFKLKDTVICITISILFGGLIDIFLFIIGKTPSTNVFLNYGYSISGILLISIAVSFAMKADVAYLALDDFLKNMKVHIFKGSIVKAVNTSFFIGFIIAVTFGLASGKVHNMSILTIVASIFLGKITDIFDGIFGFKEK